MSRKKLLCVQFFIISNYLCIYLSIYRSLSLYTYIYIYIYIYIYKTGGTYYQRNQIDIAKKST